MLRTKHVPHLLLAAFSLCSLALTGCGGAGSALNSTKTGTSAHSTASTTAAATPATMSRKGKGQTTVTVKWPARSGGSSVGKSALRTRLIPSAANSIKVALTSGSAPIANTTLTRPSGGGTLVSSYTFANLAPGSLTATATAYPNADGTGNAQAASAVSTLTIVDGQDAPLTLTMDSTVASIVIGGTPSVRAHHTTAMNATALDAQGNVVLVGGTITFSSSDASAATVDPVSGVITGVSVGSTVLSATYAEAGVTVLTGTQNVAVTPNTPTAIYYSNGGTTLYRATSFSDAAPQTLTYSGMSISQMAVDSTGAIYVADSSQRILKFAGMTDTAPQILTYSGMYPQSVTLYNGMIYVGDGGGQRVLKFASMTDTTPQVLTYSGLYPASLSVDSAGAIYALNGQTVLKFASMTDTAPQTLAFSLSDPRSIGVDSNDKLYVAEHSGAKIYKFANMQDTTPTRISLPGVSSGAHNMAVYDTSIYVANTHGSNLLSYTDITDASPGTYTQNVGYVTQIAVQ